MSVIIAAILRVAGVLWFVYLARWGIRYPAFDASPQNPSEAPATNT